MKSSGVTQKDVARKAGTSASLVSRILNGKTAHISVSEETWSRVLRAAEELGYRFNSVQSSRAGRAVKQNGEGCCE